MSVSRFSQSSIQNGFEKFNNIWDGYTAVGSLEFISQIYVSQEVSSVLITNIPQTYSHLHLRASSSGTSGSAELTVIPNSNNGVLYSQNWMEGTGSNGSSGASSARTQIRLCPTSGNLDLNVCLVDFINYSTSTGAVDRSLKYFSARDNNSASSSIRLGGSSIAISSSIPISSLLFYAFTGNLLPHTRISLYGVK